MKIEQKIANHLESLARLNAVGIHHLEAAMEGQSLEHIAKLTANAVALAAEGIPLTKVNVISVKSPYVDKHNLSFLIKATRKLKTGDVEILDGNGNRCSLPAPFWVLSAYDGGADYRMLLSDLIPSNVTLVSVQPTADGKSLVFTYEDDTSGSVETVTLSMNGNKSYLSLLLGSRSAWATLTKPKVRIDDVSQDGFFEESVYVADLSLSGKNLRDDFTPSTFEPAENPNTKMREIAHEFALDNEKGFIFMMTPNYKLGDTDQENGQNWTASVSCFSDGWHKIGGHPGL